MKNEKLPIITGTLGTFIILSVLSILYLTSIISSIFYKSVLTGVIISLLNFIIGISSIKFSIKRSQKLFLIVLWGGLLIRLILILSIVVYVLIFLEITKAGFIFSVFFFYIFYLIVEIFYLNSRRINQFGGQ